MADKKKVIRHRTKLRSKKQFSSTRPFRLWDNDTQHDMPYRCYGSEYTAHNAALIIVRYAQKETIIDVHDINGERHIGTYKRLPSGIWFKERNAQWHGPKQVG